ncbi:MAG: L,D-transpeptidase family protein [Clostridia bacterium]|nr:L,D-transpeptidase family protein [Clostridia bacterium]
MKRFCLFAVFLCCFLLLSGAESANPYEIFIDGDEATLYLIEGGQCVQKFRCAVGKPDTPSPIGTFYITEKAHWGSGFGGRWLGINCKWGKFGIHGTIFPNSIGWSSSHGCFRMLNKDVEKLYDIVPVGTKVTVAFGVYGDFGNGFRYIKPGGYGSDVMRIQKRLAELGYYNGSIDGRYMSLTQNALNKYQRDNGLTVTNTVTPALQEHMGFVLME